MRTPFTVALTLLAAALRAQVFDAPVDRTPDFDGPLIRAVQPAEWFRIESHDAAPADVELTTQLLCTTVVRLRAMFGVERTNRLLRGIDCVVHLHGKPTTTVTEGRAALVTKTKDDKYGATIEILAPSGFSPTYRDIAGLPAGADHHGKVLAHEYATVLLDRVAAEKPAGWRFFSGPGWFLQGYEEYLGAAMLHADKRDAVLDAYAREQADPARVRFQPAFAVKDPYLDGAVVLHFLHDSFGGERVRAVLEAPQATFDEAFLAALGVPWREIEAKWKVWREDALARQEWRARLRDAKQPSEIAAAVVGRDLRRLPEDVRDQVIGALRTLAGKDEYWRDPGDGAPHRVYRVNSGAVRWVLVVSYEGFEVPGVSWLAAHLFDADWRQISVANFPTGYRISLFDVWQERVLALPDPVLAVRLGSIGSFGDFTYRQRQYYAVRDDRLALVRIENEGGAATRGSFAAAHPWTGPEPLRRTTAQWIESLSSPNTADVLETLTWLGGRHLPADKPRQANVNEESVEDSKAWESVRDDPRTRSALDALAKSPDRWIREAAALVLRTEK